MFTYIMCVYFVSVGLQGEHKSNPLPVTSVDISAMRADFCVKFYATVKQ